MSQTIGLLLSSSADYPSLGIDINQGLRSYLQSQQKTDINVIVENTGFGEQAAINYSKAEMMLLQHDVDVLIAYFHSSNAEQLYSLAESSGKPFIFIDPGMQLPGNSPGSHAYHISLQGVHACRLSGQMAGDHQRKVLMASSFYDAGYSGPWGFSRGLQSAGGEVCGNYIGRFKINEPGITPFLNLMNDSGAASVAACFSAQQSQLFLKALVDSAYTQHYQAPIYCSPFMAEQQWLGKCPFPGGILEAIVPWFTDLSNDVNKSFADSIRQKANKSPGMFHLLGWEAGIVAMQYFNEGFTSLNGLCYESPRGTVTMDATTHYTYAPLYKGQIIAGEQGNCVLKIEETIAVSAAEHRLALSDKPEGVLSGWRNNYLCI